MTKKELIERMELFDDDDVAIIMDGRGGWCNIEKVVKKGSSIALIQEELPVFSDN